MQAHETEKVTYLLKLDPEGYRLMVCVRTDDYIEAPNQRAVYHWREAWRDYLREDDAAEAYIAVSRRVSAYTYRDPERYFVGDTKYRLASDYADDTVREINQQFGGATPDLRALLEAREALTAKYGPRIHKIEMLIDGEPSRLNLICQDLSGAHMNFLDFRDIDLSGARLERAEAKYSLFGGAILRGANLIDSDFGSSDLTHADLTGADLTDAHLYGARICETIGVVDLGHPGGYKGIAWQRDGILIIRIGCHNFTYSEAVEHWLDMDERDEQRAACEYARVVAISRGWRIE